MRRTHTRQPSAAELSELVSRAEAAQIADGRLEQAAAELLGRLPRDGRPLRRCGYDGAAYSRRNGELVIHDGLWREAEAVGLASARAPAEGSAAEAMDAYRAARGADVRARLDLAAAMKAAGLERCTAGGRRWALAVGSLAVRAPSAGLVVEDALAAARRREGLGS